MSKRGLVLQEGQRDTIVLTPEGEFARVHGVSGVRVGDEIRFPTGMRWRPYSLVAALLIVLVGAALFQWMAPRPLFAYVTMDINPSLEFGIDSRWRVQSVVGLNPQGEALADGIAHRGRDLSDVVETVLSSLPSRELVLFTVCRANGEVDSDLLLNQLHQQVAQWQGQDLVLEAWEVSPELRESARENGLSVGRLTLALAAHDQGAEVDLEEMKWGDMVQAMAHSGINVGHLVRQAAAEKRWDLPAGEKLPAWMREGGPVPPGLDKEPGGPATPPGPPMKPPGLDKEPGGPATPPGPPIKPPGGDEESGKPGEIPGLPVQPPGLQRDD